MLSQETVTDGRKWINALLVLAGIIIAFVCIRFFTQMTEWFDLEAKIPYVNGLAQGLGIIIGMFSFGFAVKNKKAMLFLDEVYNELVNVVWAKRDDTTRLTIIIVIAVAISSVILGLLDFIIGKGLNLLY